MVRKENKGPVVIKTSSQKCQICEETVYPLDKIECEKLVFHKGCFRCCQCKKVLNLGNFKKSDTSIYCQIHYNSNVVNPNLMRSFTKNEGGEGDGVVKEEKVDLKKKEESKQTMVRDNGNKESKPVTIKTNNAKCNLCSDSVLLTEKIEVEKLIFHKSCFKCVKCKKTLNLGNFKKHDNTIYCENHYQSVINPHLKTHDNFVEHSKTDEKKKSGYSDEENDGYGNTNQSIDENDGNGNNNENNQNENHTENHIENNNESQTEEKINEEDFEVEIEVDE